MLEFRFEATKFEESWSRKALESFYEEGWIEEVLYRVKGGKEATVYCCQADPATGYDLVAAKIYRHRGLRSMKNYESYREGRFVTRDKRKLRAIKNKSRYGKQSMDSGVDRFGVHVLPDVLSRRSGCTGADRCRPAFDVDGLRGGP